MLRRCCWERGKLHSSSGRVCSIVRSSIFTAKLYLPSNQILAHHINTINTLYHVSSILSISMHHIASSSLSSISWMSINTYTNTGASTLFKHPTYYTITHPTSAPRGGNPNNVINLTEVRSVVGCRMLSSKCQRCASDDPG